MLLFELLQIALGNRNNLSCVPSTHDWVEIYKQSEQQSITGVLLHGIEKLPEIQRPPQDLLLQWIGVEQVIRYRNLIMDEHCLELIKALSSAGLHPTILKGQGLARLYPESIRALRQSGDIDIHISDGREKAIEYAKNNGQRNIEWDYKHLHLQLWRDVEVELHYHVEILQNPFRNKRLQRWFKANEDHLYWKNAEWITPTIEMNMFYVLLHIYRHFFTEGVGMRQLMDYYFVLMAGKDRAPRFSEGDSLEEVLKRFKMWEFAQGIMWIMQEVFALDREYMYCTPSEKDGRLILNTVLEGGNFGHYKPHANIKGFGKVNTVLSVAKHNLQMMSRYPTEALMSPFWYVWHKCWKIITKAVSLDS